MSADTAMTQTMLSPLVAEEIRALMARRRMTGRELARRLSVSHTWVSYRLSGSQPIDLNDLGRIAGILGVPAGDLLPREHDRATRREPENPLVATPKRDPLAPRVVAVGGQTTTRHRSADHPVGVVRAVRTGRDTAESARRPVTAVAR